MIPTISAVREWAPLDLSSNVDATRTVASTAGAVSDAMARAATDLWQGWSSKAADAAYEHFEFEKNRQSSVIEAIEDLAETIESTRVSLASALSVAHDKIFEAEEAGFVVDDNGVHGNGSVGADGLDAAGRWSMIQDALRAIGEADAELTRRLELRIAALGTVMPPAPAFAPDEAQNSLSMFDDGYLSPEEIGRLRANLAAAGIDPSAWADIVDGDVVSTLPRGAFEYLERLYLEAGVDGVLDMQRMLVENGSPSALEAREALANGLLVLSHENIRDVDDARGGWDRLPPDIRELSASYDHLRQYDTEAHRHAHSYEAYLATLTPDEIRVVTDDPASGLRGYDEFRASFTPAAAFDAAARDREFWDFVGSADGVPGVELSTTLLQNAAARVDLVDKFESPEPDQTARPNHNAMPLVELATRNHDANTRILTGDVDGDLRPDIQRDDVLTPLFTHDWADGGAAVAHMTEWMTDDLVVAQEAGRSDLSVRADRAALGLAQYLGDEDNYRRLMDVQGENTANIGEVNPHLTRGIALGLHGYIPDLISTEGSSTWPAEALEPTNDYHRAQRIFTLVSTDAESAATFGTASATYSRILQGQFIDEGNTASAHYAGRLQALGDVGIYAAAAEQSSDRAAIESYMRDRRADAYNTNFSIVRNLVALHPATSATIGLALDLSNTSLRDMVALPDEDSASAPFTITETNLTVGNEHGLLSHAVATRGLPNATRISGDLLAVGAISADGEPRGLPERHDQARAIAAYEPALRWYGVDHVTYNTRFRLGYGDIAPQVGRASE